MKIFKKAFLSIFRKVKIQAWALVLLFLTPYILGVSYLAYTAPVLIVVGLVALYLKEIFLAVNTALLIRNNIELFIAKRLFQSRADAAEKRMIGISKLVKDELVLLEKDNRKMKREMDKIKQEHIELRATVKMLEILVLRNN